MARKCVVWDLDDTLWQGVCLEGPVTVFPGVVAAIRELDARGVLHSIASGGVAEVSMAAGAPLFLLLALVETLISPTARRTPRRSGRWHSAAVPAAGQ